MKIEYIGLLVTLLLGIFIVIGALIAYLAKKKEKIIDFSLGLAFSVIIMLIIADLIPEIIESLGLTYIWVFLIFTIIGYGLLKILDHFIPDHEDHKMTKKELTSNLAHIGIVSSIALIIHNIIEGMAIYSTVITSVPTGLMLGIGVGFHNLPLGMVIATTFYQTNQDKRKGWFYISAVALSTLLGGLVMFLFRNYNFPELVLGILLSITLGMLLFIVLSELWPRIKKSNHKTERNLGIILGIILLLLSLMI